MNQMDYCHVATQPKYNYYLYCVKENQFKFKETELILSDLRSPMELLNNRIVDHGIGPIYRFLKRNTSGEQFIYHYSCTLFGMYGE